MARKASYDVVIVGAGIAGASCAWALTRRGLHSILIAEQEQQPGYHSTGRSAACLATLQLQPVLMRLTLMAVEFFKNPPDGFAEHPLLDRTGALLLFDDPVWELVEQFVPTFRRFGGIAELLTPSQAVERIPVLERECGTGAVWLPEDGRLDVNELLWGYLNGARKAGALLRCNAKITGIGTEAGAVKSVRIGEEEIPTKTVVNAAGAWAGRIGRLAGAAPIELQPRRRTAATFRPPEHLNLDVRRWPLVGHESRGLYFVPQGELLMISPMDEEPSEPVDARPEDTAVAIAMDRLGRLAPALVPHSLVSKWAGLRTFAEDGCLVIGPDPRVKGFFWLAGHGGCGIETSPAAAEIAADLLVEGRTTRFDADELSPARLEAGR